MIILLKEANAPTFKIDLGSSMSITVEDAMKTIITEVNIATKKRLFPTEEEATADDSSGSGGGEPRSDDPAVQPLWKLTMTPPTTTTTAAASSGTSAIQPLPTIKQLLHGRYGNIAAAATRRDMILRYVNQGDSLVLIRSSGPLVTKDALCPPSTPVAEKEEEEETGGFLRPTCHIRCPCAVVTNSVKLTATEVDVGEEGPDTSSFCLSFTLALDRSVPSTAPIMQCTVSSSSGGGSLVGGRSTTVLSTIAVALEDFAAGTDLCFQTLTVQLSGEDDVIGIDLQQVASSVNGSARSNTSVPDFRHIIVTTSARFSGVKNGSKLTLQDQTVHLGGDPTDRMPLGITDAQPTASFELHRVFGDDDDSGGVVATAAAAFHDTCNDTGTTADRAAVCAICISELSNVVILPCNHKCLCTGCSALYCEKAKICPICRRTIENVLKL